MNRRSGRCPSARAVALPLLLAAGMLGAAEQAQAQDRHGPGPHAGQRAHAPQHRAVERHWHGDIARFHEHDWPRWRSGHWRHERHGGRLGWWWVVGPSWYFYPQPVYPYPNPWEPADVIVTAPGALAPMPPAQYWYYCEALRNYYPYVTACPGGWKRVPAVPDAAAVPVPRVP